MSETGAQPGLQKLVSVPCQGQQGRQRRLRFGIRERPILPGLDGLVLDGVKATIGEDRLELSGTIPLDTSVDGLELTVAAQGSNLDQFVPIEFDQFDIKDAPFKIGGKIQLAEGILSVEQLIFSASRGSMTGELRVVLEDPRKFGQFDLKASGDDLKAFTPTMPEYRPAAVPFDLIARGSWLLFCP